MARAGPTAVRILADWGADVIRVEPPATKEPGNHDIVGGQRHGPDFQNLHRNKRSLTLNLKTDAGREVFYDLVRTADVVVENMRPEVKHRLRIDFETLREINDRLIYASISGFGQDGPYAGRGSVDQVAQGMSGLMSVNGLPEQGPLRVGIPVSDLAAGMYLAIGVLIAIHERERSSKGQWVQTSLLEAMIAMLDFKAARWTVAGEVPSQEGNHHPVSVPMGCYRTADGWLNVAGPSGRLYTKFCETLGVTELMTDPLFATPDSRSKNRLRLNEIIGSRLKERTTSEWVDVFNDAGVPAGPVNRIDEALCDPQVRHLGMETTVHHPILGPLSIVRNAVQMTGTPRQIYSASPELGEHTDEILAAIGVSPLQVARLKESGVI
jgi:crotonobetainyl-CoA:carnitine CoA-transferase CaiB-like acyl-CoA transferase